MAETSSRVSSENCIGSVENPSSSSPFDPCHSQPQDNSWNRYNEESPPVPAWDSSSNQNLNTPQYSYVWPQNQEIMFQNRNRFQQNSNYTNPTRIYGNPILGRQQRPTILVIVVNKPPTVTTANANRKVNFQATTSEGYPIRGDAGAANYPIGRYQKGGSDIQVAGKKDLSTSVNSDNHSANDIVQNQISSNEVMNESNNQERSDSGQDRKPSCDCCTCTSDDQFDDENDLSKSNVNCECTCDIGELERNLQDIIPNEECLCYLANRKKTKKRKPRSVFDRFASPPFVIEPKPNPYCYPWCCPNRSCCYSCCNNCCNSCYNWC